MTCLLAACINFISAQALSVLITKVQNVVYWTLVQKCDFV